MTAADLAELEGNVRLLHEALRAHLQFRDEVGALMLRMADERDPTGRVVAFVLLELIRDLEARTGELTTEKGTG